MADEVEILYQKTVTLVSPEDEIAGHLFAAMSGPGYTVRISWNQHTSEHTAWNLFTALVNVRRDLENQGLIPAVEGACRDVYPSRMALEMGGGRRAQLWTTPSIRPSTVDVFADVPPPGWVRLASVIDQGNAHRARTSRSIG